MLDICSHGPWLDLFIRSLGPDVAQTMCDSLFTEDPSTGELRSGLVSKFVVSEKGPPPKGHYKGRCAEYSTTFVCFRFVPRGASKKPPLPAEDAAEQLCID